MTEGANSGGVEGVTIRRDFECFDKLPQPLRVTLANAHSKYCSVQLFNLWARNVLPVDEIIGEIVGLNQRAERDLAEKIEKAKNDRATHNRNFAGSARRNRGNRQRHVA